MVSVISSAFLFPLSLPLPDTVARFFFSPSLSLSLSFFPFFLSLSPSLLLPLSLPPVRDGIPAAGDLLLPEPGRGHGVRGHLPAGAVRGAERGERRSQPLVRRPASFAKAQGLQETGTVSPAEARVLLTDIVHYQCV